METSRIAAVPLFADLPPEELERLASVATELAVETGEPLAEEGEFGHALFAIENGSAEVIVDGEVMRTVAAGDVVGEVAVLSSGRRTATVVATEPLRLIVFFKRDVWALERNAPEVAERLRELLAEHRDNS